MATAGRAAGHLDGGPVLAEHVLSPHLHLRGVDLVLVALEEDVRLDHRVEHEPHVLRMCDAAIPRRLGVQRELEPHLGFGRIVGSAIEVPNMLVGLV
jgi:hypothetical protein